MLHDFVHLFAPVETGDAKQDQRRRSAPEPVEVVNILAGDFEIAATTTLAHDLVIYETVKTHPNMPVIMFIGRTIVPRTVSFPRTSAVCY